jgi:arylsulfatase A-like enzyme
MALLNGCGPAAASADRSHPGVLLYVIDTLRPDHLGCYGYERPTTPNIDRFAEAAILFEEAHAQSSWTRSSMASILTGLPPQAHGANNRDQAISREARLVGEILQDSGYRTAGFLTNGNAGPGVNFAQGYSEFTFLEERAQSPDVHVLADRVNEEVFSWLDEHADPGEPFFLYVHTTDPHDPHTPREPYRTRFAPDVPSTVGTTAWFQDLRDRRIVDPKSNGPALRALYDAEIAFNDHHFGELVGQLERRGLYEDMLVILTSDHGEAFWEHGWRGHGMSLHVEESRVPLIIKMPKARPMRSGRASAAAQHIDILPTILDVIGAEPLPALPGRSLVAPAPDEAHPHSAFSYLELDDRHSEAVRVGTWSLIRDLREPDRVHRLYDLASDPGEHVDCKGTNPEASRRLVQALDEHRERHQHLALPKAIPTSSPEFESALRVLGYVE